MTTDDDLARAVELLPAWFVGRMMTDVWGFGFLLSTGGRVHLKCINSVRQAADGTIWLDVTLHDRQPAEQHGYFIARHDDRTDASLNAAHVVMAFETETS